MDELPRLPEGFSWREETPRAKYHVTRDNIYRPHYANITVHNAGKIEKITAESWKMTIQIDNSEYVIYIEIPCCNYVTAAVVLANSIWQLVLEWSAGKE